MTETAKAPVRCGLSGTALKYIACITMLIDHIGASCIEAGILLPALAAGAASCSGIPVSTLLAADRVLRYIGRLAFPIFCFLAVEGFLHTHDVKKYVRRLLLFGLLSEVPFDLAFFRTPFAPQHQSVYWTLALGVLAMYAASLVDYHVWHRLAWPMLGISLLLLAIVLFMPEYNGCKRWIVLPGLGTLQPSEIAKFSIVLVFSHIISLNHDRMKSFSTGVVPFALILGVVTVLMLSLIHI